MIFANSDRNCQSSFYNLSKYNNYSPTSYDIVIFAGETLHVYHADQRSSFKPEELIILVAASGIPDCFILLKISPHTHLLQNASPFMPSSFNSRSNFLS